SPAGTLLHLRRQLSLPSNKTHFERIGCAVTPFARRCPVPREGKMRLLPRNLPPLIVGLCLLWRGIASPATPDGGQAGPASSGPADPKLIEDLVAANRVLPDQGVLDGYGHVSVRDGRDPNRYLMSRSLAPELVTAADVLEYDLDSNGVDPKGRSLYLERFMHGEIYKARPDVKAI